MTTKTKKVIGMDLFAGAGGMSLGAALAGVDVKLAVESDPYAAATYSRNHPKTEVLNTDIRKLKNFKLPSGKAPSILFGGPPCQGFSTSNQITRNSENPHNWLFKEYLRFARFWRPDWVIFENVKGITETEGGLFLELISSKLEKLGYTLTCHILNSADFGVPQKRKRLFLIGSLHGLSVNISAGGTRKNVSVGDAISDLPNLENGASKSWRKYKFLAKSGFAKKMRKNLKESPNHILTKNAEYILERYKYIPQGGNWEHIPKKLLKNYKDISKCHTGTYHRLTLSEPAIVIGNFRKNMFIHPTENRGLSVREAARIQSFPDWYEFMGSIGFQQQQVGNAVPPLLAKYVFERILNS